MSDHSQPSYESSHPCESLPPFDPADFLIYVEEEADLTGEPIDPVAVGRVLYQEGGLHFYGLWTYWLSCHPELNFSEEKAEYYWRQVFY